MLPDFPALKQWIKERLHDQLRVLSENDPFMSSLRVERYLEGSRLKCHTADGYQDEAPYTTLSSGFEFKRADILEKGGPAVFLEATQRIAEEIKKQKSEMVFKKLNEITEATGNVVKGNGGPPTPELLLQVLEKMDIDFDEEGNPHMPSLVVSPDMHNAIQAKLPEWDKDESIKERQKELIEKKRKEWHDREGNRKLVD